LVDIKGVPLNALHEAICPDPTLPLHLARVAAQVACATAVKAAAGAAAVEAISATGPRVPADVPMLGTTHGADEPDALAGGQGFDTSELLVPALRDIRAPAMYTALGAAGAAEPCTGSDSPAGGGPGAPPALNARASWLARRPVHGDALLSAVRLRPNEWGTPVVKYGAFALRDYAPWAAAGLPASEHGGRVGMPLLACLPLRFTCARHYSYPAALPPALAAPPPACRQSCMPPQHPGTVTQDGRGARHRAGPRSAVHAPGVGCTCALRCRRRCQPRRRPLPASDRIECLSSPAVAHGRSCAVARSHSSQDDGQGACRMRRASPGIRCVQTAEACAAVTGPLWPPRDSAMCRTAKAYAASAPRAALAAYLTPGAAAPGAAARVGAAPLPATGDAGAPREPPRYAGSAAVQLLDGAVLEAAESPAMGSQASSPHASPSSHALICVT